MMSLYNYFKLYKGCNWMKTKKYFTIEMLIIVLFLVSLIITFLRDLEVIDYKKFAGVNIVISGLAIALVITRFIELKEKYDKTIARLQEQINELKNKESNK